MTRLRADFIGGLVYRTDIVAVRVTHIRQVDLAHRELTKPRRVFTRDAAVGNARRMESVRLLG